MPDPQEIPDVQARLERLEQQVAWLVAQEQGRQGAIAPPPQEVPSAPPALPGPMPPPLPAAVSRRPSAGAGLPKLPSISPTILMAGAGAAIFLLGALFFLHWSIQRGWIGPEIRLLLGLAAGGGLTFGAARLILGDGRKLGICLLLAGVGTLMFTFRAGAVWFHLFPNLIGFAGTALAVIVAGALAARARSGGALTVALVAGLLAPIAFSTGSHQEVALALYLACLLGAALAVPYLTGTGARWGFTRWLGLAGTWLFLAVAVAMSRSADASPMFALLALHLLLAGIWAWMPRHAEKPSTPTLLWILVSLAATSLGYALWRQLDLPSTTFAGPVVLVALLNLLLVKPLRARLGGRQADLGLLVLAIGHLVLAVPVALEWRWVGPLWGIFALLLAWAAGYSETRPEWQEETPTLRRLALGLAIVATFRWLFHGLDFWHGALNYPVEGCPRPFLNTAFLEGLVTALAFALLARSGKALAVVGNLGLQIVGGVTLALEVAHLVRHLGASNRGAEITLTLVWALLGAGQWLASLSRDGKTGLGLAIAGYVWLALASGKLILKDLANADTPLRALVFLGVGAIFLGTALIGNRVKRRRGEAE